MTKITITVTWWHVMQPKYGQQNCISMFWNKIQAIWRMRLCHPPDGSTSPEYKLLCFIATKFFCKDKNTLAFNRDRCCHLVICLRLIPFHWNLMFLHFFWLKLILLLWFFKTIGFFFFKLIMEHSALDTNDSNNYLKLLSMSINSSVENWN